MKKTVHSKLLSLLTVVAFMGLSFGSANAQCASNDPSAPQGIVPVLLPGNPALCDGGYRVDPPTSGTYSLGSGSVTIVVSNTSCGQVFSWSVSGNVAINKIVVKGGNNANEYVYNGQNSDGNLHSPVNSSGNYASLSHIDFCYSTAANYELTISKTISRTFTRTYLWNLEKECLGPDPLILEPGQTYDYPFMMTVTTINSDKDWKAFGTITVQNFTPLAAAITSVTDMVTPGNIPSTVVCPVSFPYTLPAGATLVCDYMVNLPNGDSRVSTATVTTSTPNMSGASASSNINFVNPTIEIDECAGLWDDCFPGAPMTVFCYTGGTYYFSCPVSYEECGTYEFSNTAFTRTNQRAIRSYASCGFTVEVPCEEEGCTRTIGYWSTHSSYGPASYDATWGLVGENTTFFLSGKTYYEVMWTPVQGNAYYILAPQYVAAKLNQLAGAAIPPAVLTAYNTATTLLNTYTPLQIKNMNSNNPIRQQFVSVAGILDDYNNGVTGPGHCEENNNAGYADLQNSGDIYLTAQPNPFVGEAQFTLSVPYDSPVTLDVFNASGQRVSTLFSGYLSADEERTVNFQASGLPEGLYIYRLTTDREVRAGQVVSMK